MTEYRDNNRLDPKTKYQISEIPTFIRNKNHIKDVREAIAQGLERTYEDAINHDNASFEVSMARGQFADLNGRITNTDIVKADKNWVESTFSTIQNQFSATFYTLAALKSAYPNGASGVFLVIENNHIYKWEVNSWVDKGEYVIPPTGEAYNKNNLAVNTGMLQGEKGYRVDFGVSSEVVSQGKRWLKIGPRTVPETYAPTVNWLFYKGIQPASIDYPKKRVRFFLRSYTDMRFQIGYRAYESSTQTSRVVNTGTIINYKANQNMLVDMEILLDKSFNSATDYYLLIVPTDEYKTSTYLVSTVEVTDAIDVVSPVNETAKKASDAIISGNLIPDAFFKYFKVENATHQTSEMNGENVLTMIPTGENKNYSITIPVTTSIFHNDLLSTNFVVKQKIVSEDNCFWGANLIVTKKEDGTQKTFNSSSARILKNNINELEFEIDLNEPFYDKELAIDLVLWRSSRNVGKTKLFQPVLTYKKYKTLSGEYYNVTNLGGSLVKRSTYQGRAITTINANPVSAENSTYVTFAFPLTSHDNKPEIIRMNETGALEWKIDLLNLDTDRRNFYFKVEFYLEDNVKIASHDLSAVELTSGYHSLTLYDLIPPHFYYSRMELVIFSDNTQSFTVLDSIQKKYLFNEKKSGYLCYKPIIFETFYPQITTQKIESKLQSTWNRFSSNVASVWTENRIPINTDKLSAENVTVDFEFDFINYNPKTTIRLDVKYTLDGESKNQFFALKNEAEASHFSGKLYIPRFNEIKNFRFVFTNTVTGLFDYAVSNFTAKQVYRNKEEVLNSGNRLAKINIIGDLSGMSKENKVNCIVTIEDNGFVFSEYATCGYQGNSSLYFEKKSYRLTFYTDSTRSTKKKIDILPYSVPVNAINVKAYWADWTCANNLLGAKYVAMHTLANSDGLEVYQKEADNQEQIVGYPCTVSLNGNYNGLYGVSSKKDETLFNADEDNPLHCVLTGETENATTQFKTDSALYDGTDFGPELPDDVPQEMQIRFNEILKLVNSGSDAQFAAEIGNRINLTSMANYITVATLMQAYDIAAKNICYQTWDGGEKWSAVIYDVDSLWGVHWEGTSQFPDGHFSLSSFMSQNKLVDRLIRTGVLTEKLVLSYQALRKQYSSQDVITDYRDFLNHIGIVNYRRNAERWTSQPYTNGYTANDLFRRISDRFEKCDNWFTNEYLDNLKS